MKKFLLTALTLAVVAAPVLAERVHDVGDLEGVHQHVLDAIGELERARAANHYDMQGHGARAEQLLHDAERELHAAIESSRHAR